MRLWVFPAKLPGRSDMIPTCVQKKTGGKRAKKNACLLLCCALLLGACSRQAAIETGDENTRNAAANEEIESGISAREMGRIRRLVLEQGNEWTAGVPGFGVNAIPALAGEYSANDGRRFQVWLTREVLYFDNAWIPLSDLVETRTRAASGGTLAARPLNGVWSVVFLFGDGFGNNEQVEIMRACAPRFTQFVFQTNRMSDSSFPAIIELVPLVQ
jgi:hypothetical protein